jgi:hypothetical protein
MDGKDRMFVPRGVGFARGLDCGRWKLTLLSPHVMFFASRKLLPSPHPNCPLSPTCVALKFEQN